MVYRHEKSEIRVRFVENEFLGKRESNKFGGSPSRARDGGRARPFWTHYFGSSGTNAWRTFDCEQI